MTYELVIGDRIYSSWSLRGWLLFAAFNIEVKTTLLPMRTKEFQDRISDFAPARLVPAMSFEGVTVYDTLAMGETLAERHPELKLWPEDPVARGLARSVTAEMHSGFTALRSACPMVLSHGWMGFEPSDAVRADLARIEELWNACPGHEDSWLFAEYSIADVFYAPVAMRIAGYDLPVGDRAKAYIRKHLEHQPIRQWRAMGIAERSKLSIYDLGYPHTDWPGPAPVGAMVEIGSLPVNRHCPFSGEKVQPDSLARLGDDVVGFCNRFCRDKFVADPEAWPEAMALLS